MQLRSVTPAETLDGRLDWEVLTTDASSFMETLDDAGPWDMLRHATACTMQRPIRATCNQRPHKELRRYLFQEINGTV
jgi:hypothetical protein